jgi:hypothetical protein
MSGRLSFTINEKSLAVVIDQNSQRPIGIAFTIVSAIRR